MSRELTIIRDLRLFPTTGIRLALLLAVLLVGLLPWGGSGYLLDVANRTGIAVIAALGLNILTGFTGLISLGNAAFMAIGAFASGYFAVKLGMNTLWTIPLAGLITALLGMVVGIPSLRLKGLYLAMATLAAHFLVEFLIVRWESVTGGVNGLSIPPPMVAGIPLDSDRAMFALIYPLTLLALLFATNLFRTRVGRSFIAIRDQETAAGVMGIDVFRGKLLAFGLSSFFVGVSGALLACHAKIISPENFPITLAIDSLAMIIIGGLGSVAGSLFGAVFLTLLPEGLRLLTAVLSAQYPALVGMLASLKELVFSGLIIIFLIYAPHGLAGWWRKLLSHLGAPDAEQ
jgi:branched-chain amino acid transport system permease protein